MLNAEKYRDEIFREAEKQKEDPCGCVYPFTLAIDKVSGRLRPLDAAIKWLLSEYEPPFLENGDNLKSGDWIMVKDLHDDKWIKRKFLAYADNLFWCYLSGSNCMGSGWQQARLPEEGE